MKCAECRYIETLFLPGDNIAHRCARTEQWIENRFVESPSWCPVERGLI